MKRKCNEEENNGSLSSALSLIRYSLPPATLSPCSLDPIRRFYAFVTMVRLAFLTMVLLGATAGMVGAVQHGTSPSSSVQGIPAHGTYMGWTLGNVIRLVLLDH